MSTSVQNQATVYRAPHSAANKASCIGRMSKGTVSAKLNKIINFDSFDQLISLTYELSKCSF
jgi:hypothetical protein